MTEQKAWRESLIRTRVHKIEGTTFAHRLQNSIEYYKELLDKYEKKHYKHATPNPKMTINKLAVLEEVARDVLICGDCHNWNCGGCI